LIIYEFSLNISFVGFVTNEYFSDFNLFKKVESLKINLGSEFLSNEYAILPIIYKKKKKKKKKNYNPKK